MEERHLAVEISGRCRICGRYAECCVIQQTTNNKNAAQKWGHMSTKASQKGTKEQMSGKTTIRERLQKAISKLVLFSIVPLVLLTVILNLSSTMRTLESDMQVVAQISADRISEELQVTTTIVSELGCSYQLSSPVFTQEQKQQFINQRVEAYGMVRGKLIGSNGVCAYDGTDYSERDYFKRSMQGEVVVSDPVIAKTDGKLSVIISAPVYEDGDKSGDVIGVVFVVPDPEFLNDIAVAISISKNSECYLLGATGITIAHSDSAIAQEQKNNTELSQTDRSLRGIAKVEQEMMTGDAGYDTYMRNGIYTIQAYAPIEGTNGWSVAVDAPLTDFLSSTIACIVIGIAVGAVAVVFSMRRAKQIGQNIGEPVAKCTERLRLLAEGDLHTPAPEIRTQDETQILAEATAALSGNLQKVIGDADYLLGEMSGGNFAIATNCPEAYVGDFQGLLDSIRKLNRKLSETLNEIKTAVGQVSLGANQMADAAQGLAEGATDQAGSVEELQATITNVTEIVEKNAKALGDSYQKAMDYQQQAKDSGAEMKGLTDAMQRINDTSKQISDIIGEIEDIASQTNLLSLNAAIEAARAGEAGRGFAVVADQIRKLADDSAQSAVHTRELIETSLQEIEHGNQITDKTAEALQKVVEGIEDLANESRKAMEESKAQADAMMQIEQGIEQISTVVQNNSATAEETSATSEELSAQATNMNELTSAFQLRDM